MPLGFLGIFSPLKSCTDRKAPLFQGQIWAFPEESGSRVYSQYLACVLCKCLVPPHLSQLSLLSLSHLFPGPREYNRGENKVLRNPEIPGDADARSSPVSLLSAAIRAARRAEEEYPCGIPIRSDAQHLPTPHDPVEPLGLCWHQETREKPETQQSRTALPLCAITQHREQTMTPSVMLRHQSQISTSFMEGFMY